MIGTFDIGPLGLFQTRLLCGRRREPRPADPVVRSVLAALGDEQTSGLVRAPTGLFRVERGYLSHRPADAIWTLIQCRVRGLAENRPTPCRADVRRRRPRARWHQDNGGRSFHSRRLELAPSRSEARAKASSTLAPAFWAARWLAGAQRQVVLYPHFVANGRRRAIDLAVFPRAGRYLESHRKRLSRRRYVADSGREWYEIWVPHNPKEWSLPKIVFPDIAAQPRFFLDRQAPWSTATAIGSRYVPDTSQTGYC